LTIAAPGVDKRANVCRRFVVERPATGSASKPLRRSPDISGDTRDLAVLPIGDGGQPLLDGLAAHIIAGQPKPVEQRDVNHMAPVAFARDTTALGDDGQKQPIERHTLPLRLLVFGGLQAGAIRRCAFLRLSLLLATKRDTGALRGLPDEIDGGEWRRGCARRQGPERSHLYGPAPSTRRKWQQERLEKSKRLRKPQVPGRAFARCDNQCRRNG
jgi:hypothetical protein